MPDQAELRVNVVTSGKAELDGITTAIQALEQRMLTSTMSMKEYEAAMAAVEGLEARRKVVIKELADAEKALAD